MLWVLIRSALTVRYLLEAPQRGAFNEYPQHDSYGKIRTIIPELSPNTPP